MSDLNGKRVLITGSGQGIGAAIAELAIARGASVIISDIDTELAAETAARLGAAGTANADVTDEGSITSAIQSAIEQLGGLDVLVNNAGIEVASPLLLQSTESFDQIFAVNVRGTFLGMKAAAPALVASGGNIVNIGA